MTDQARDCRGSFAAAEGGTVARQPGPPPVFIAGCGRSGTSYLRTLIDAHPDIAIPSESLFLVDYLRFVDRGVPAFVWRWLLAREPQLLCWHNGALPRSGGCADTLAALHAEYARRRGAKIWGQKTPRFVRWRSVFDSAFGSVRWILVHRDPRAVVASMLASGQHTYSLARATGRWRRDNRLLMNHVRTQSRDPNVLVVGYSDLVSATEATLADIFAFLDVPPRPLEELIAQAEPVFFSRSRFRSNTIRGGLTPEPSTEDRWAAALTAGQVRYIEWQCAAEMQVLGYERRHAGERPSLVDRFVAHACGWRDVWIVARYLWLWPEYPAWTALRTVVLRVLGVRRRRA